MIRENFPTFIQTYARLTKVFWLSRLIQTYALLTKDFRLFRLPILALLVITLVCDLEAILWALAPVPPGPGALIYAHLYPQLILACALTALLAAAFGGTAIASERGNSTADFLAMLPVTRIQIVLSKWIVSFVVLAIFAMIQGKFAVIYKSSQGNVISEFVAQSAKWPLISNTLLSYAVCFFGVAWLFSTFSNSGPISVFASLAVTFGLHTLISQNLTGNLVSESDVLFTLNMSMWLIGLTSLVAGTIYYLRRIAP